MAGRSDWMKQQWDLIKSRPIWRIAIPGTHNSGVYTGGAAFANQERNIGEQLEGGIRALDIRVKENWGQYIMHHNGYPPWPIGDAQRFDDALDQIGSFVTNHEYEIVVVLLTPGSGSNLKPDDEKVRSMVLERLEPRLVPWDPASTYTPEAIRSTGKNAILLSEFTRVPGKEALFWDIGTTLRHTWDPYQSDVLKTPEDKRQWLEKHLHDAMPQPRSYFLWGDAQVYTLDLPQGAVDTNRLLRGWLAEWATDPSVKKGWNIFAVDYFDDETVQAIVDLNSVR